MSINSRLLKIEKNRTAKVNDELQYSPEANAMTKQWLAETIRELEAKKEAT